MLGKALADIFVADGHGRCGRVLDFLGTPLIALLIAVFVAMFTLGRGAGHGPREAIRSRSSSRCPPIAGILLIVAAGGGFKQTLVDTGIGGLVADWVENSGLSVLLLAWLVAVLIRLATGSATVATVTASGILAAAGQPTSAPARPRCWSSPSAPARCSSPTSTTPASGWSRSTSASTSARPSSPGR